MNGSGERQSRLRGRGIERPDPVPGKEELSEGNLKGKTLIQQDSGKEFEVVGVRAPEFGTSKRPVANLESVDGKGGSVTLGVEDLLEKLKTPGGPWSLKE